MKFTLALVLAAIGSFASAAAVQNASVFSLARRQTSGSCSSSCNELNDIVDVSPGSPVPSIIQQCPEVIQR
ncbi:hypothetical protein M407DRAFT_28150 [Tulasnella calospora MUT 4182]|uniref:Uncharacterized protein n=1 Tax=Tulasnella calospora MUT 4182 TaxID=1051891 RepID=A0A0C3Q204_9AGAM|nr:hypothetical protein M407DRAFT_28150 [Tulasnella calospora MUT 4182]